MCFIFLNQVNIIFMQPLYEAVTYCDCIIKPKTKSSAKTETVMKYDVSLLLAALLRKVLMDNPSKRRTMEQIHQHPWYNKNFNKSRGW